MTEQQPRWREGVRMGLIGYAAVAFCYLLLDVLAMRGPLFTVNMLGRALFRRLRDPAVLQLPVERDWPALLAYNAGHLVAALAIGMIVVWLLHLAAQHPERRGMIRAVVVAGGVVTVLLVGLLTAPIRPLLPWWSIVLANLLAVAVAGWDLLRRRPVVWEQVALARG